jgi:hypothetical protein
MLLRDDIHALFDSYAISINPDVRIHPPRGSFFFFSTRTTSADKNKPQDNYKIVCFAEDGKNIAGRYLDRQLLEDPRRPVDQLLRWHFRQAVLANVRGSGEPAFECDFPAGSDMIGEIMNSPKAAERMEFELFSRLAVGSRRTPIDS